MTIPTALRHTDTDDEDAEAVCTAMHYHICQANEQYVKRVCRIFITSAKKHARFCAPVRFVRVFRVPRCDDSGRAACCWLLAS